MRDYRDLVGYDLGKAWAGDYDYAICTSRRFLRLRRRFLPWTLRYETRHEPPHPNGGVIYPVQTPLMDMIPRTQFGDDGVCRWRPISLQPPEGHS